MGFLRLYLAVAVLLWHYLFVPQQLRNALFPHSFIAVCIFFIISGFYISLVLHESYDHPYGIYDFYLNRVLRIYPVYWVVLLGLVAVINFGLINDTGLEIAFPWNSPLRFQTAMDLGMRLWGIIGEILIFPAVFSLTANSFSLTSGQMLTVGLELTFYLVAPFMVKRPLPLLVCLLVGSWALHLAPSAMNLPARPWQYEFFPCIVTFFLAGALSYRIYQRIRTLEFPSWWGWLTLGFLFCYFLVFRNDLIMEKWTNSGETLGLYVLVTLAIPFLFHASKNSKRDRFVGDLSYPLYVVHFPVIWVLGNEWDGAVLVPVITLGLSVLLVLLVERPMHKFRHGLSVKTLISGN